MNAKFISYQKVENQHYKGIVTISYKDLILRFKVIPLKSGSGCFCAPISFKFGDDYVSSFETTDPKELKSIQTFALEEAKKHLTNPPKQPEANSIPF